MHDDALVMYRVVYCVVLFTADTHDDVEHLIEGIGSGHGGITGLFNQVCCGVNHES
jgi:hypothetical protein